MSNFQNSTPEAGIQPAQLMGEAKLPDTPLLGLRRQQLVDLAAAFNIDIGDKDAPKSDILPAMIAAERQGVFKQIHMADRALLIRAGWTKDQGPFPKEELEALELQPEPEQHVLGRGPSTKGGGLKEGLKEFQELQRRAKEIDPDFNPYGMKKEELRAFVDQHGGADDS